MAGQWVNSRIPLNNSNAKTGRVTTRKNVPTALGRTNRRSIHAGTPAISSGGAISVNSMCWTMCMR